MSKEIAEEYASSLADLTVNSKPLINMLTILAEENIAHAAVIVDTVEKHLEKVQPEIKLPVLYLVDSIVKNVGGAYSTKFSQIIVSMFTRTFRQVDEKVRSQMFKLRETWHDVFTPSKLYQLDVKVNLIDPAWPIQVQHPQSSIHVNPTFLKKPVATTSSTPTLTEKEEEMRSIVAKKEQELLMLQRKKVEMELQQTRKQLEMAEKNVNKVTPASQPAMPVSTMPATMLNPVVVPPTAPPVVPDSATRPALSVKQRLGPMTPASQPAMPLSTMPAAMANPVVMPPTAPAVVPDSATRPVLSVKQRLGPPVNKPATGARIAPVSSALVAARRDPRLVRNCPSTSVPLQVPNLYIIKHLDHVVKRKNVITIDVRPPDASGPKRRDPRLEKRIEDKQRNKSANKVGRVKKIDDDNKKHDEPLKITEDKNDAVEKTSVDQYLEKLQVPDPKVINMLPPIPKINREEVKEKDLVSQNRKKETSHTEKRKKRERDTSVSNKDSFSSSSPEKKVNKKLKKNEIIKKLKTKEQNLETEIEHEVVAFKELKNYHKDRYMRRNKEKSESPETIPIKMKDKPVAENESKNVPDVTSENKDIDLRVLPIIVDANSAPIAEQKSSTDDIENKSKKAKLDKFDILFGNEDVDLRQLPQVDKVSLPAPPCIMDSSISENTAQEGTDINSVPSPQSSPKQKDWNEVKEKTEHDKKTPTKLDLVRAKLAEATKGKDRLGRPLLFSKSPSLEKERRRTISSEDVDLRVDNSDDMDTAHNKKTISIIMNQAKEQYKTGQLDKNQYETLMYQVFQLNEKLKLKEAKQKESFEKSKMKLKAHIDEGIDITPPPKASPIEQNSFGDIDERVPPSVYVEIPLDNKNNHMPDLDMRVNTVNSFDESDSSKSKGLLPRPAIMPIWNQPYPPPSMWRMQPRPRMEEYIPRRPRGPMIPPYFRGKLQRGPRPVFDQRMPILPTPKLGMAQGECPLMPYERVSTPPPLGILAYTLPPTNYKILEYIDQDPVKTIQIDGILREIRFYGETAIIMLDWDDPREIKFLPGSRRVTVDNKDSVVLSFNEGYKQIEIDDQVFDIRFGAPTRELYINHKWYECLFGAQPIGIIVDGAPHLIHLEGPLPQVDIGKVKRTDLVAGKVNLIVDAMHMCPVFLDAKVQKFFVNGKFFTIRFVDAFRTVLINEQPFEVEFGGLPRPIVLGDTKHFIRFSVLPRHVVPGVTVVANMEGSIAPVNLMPIIPMNNALEQAPKNLPRPIKTPSPENESQGLDILASLMPTSMAPATGSEYSLAEPLFSKSETIPGLDTQYEEQNVKPTLPILGNLNVNDLFAKLVATGIVKAPETKKEDGQTTHEVKTEEVKAKIKEDKHLIHKVDLLKPETLRTKQPGLVAKLYGGMQCSGCGARFPPEHTVRYSQHLDWHFRQNRRERDSARRAHSRHWHYDLSDWVQYEEIEDLEEREKSWFETGGAEGDSDGTQEATEEVPTVAAGAPIDHYCAVCGDKFDQFFNDEREEWQLRKAVKHDDKIYHPLCFEDYKTSLAKEKEERPVEMPADEIMDIDKVEEEAIEIKDADQSDNESVVEVVETEEKAPELLEIDDGDDEDVVLKAEPVEEVVVDDDHDTDDETRATRSERDRQAEIDFSKIKIKEEPFDPDDEPIITAEEEVIRASADTTHVTVESSIDGNLQLDATNTDLPIGGIRINIARTLPTLAKHPVAQKDMLEDISADDEPLPPGEETELQYELKPALQNRQLSRQPPLRKGSELSALCSIM